MIIETICLVLSITSLIFCGVTALFSFKAYCEVIGLKNSTHRIEYRPIDFKNEQFTDSDLADKLDEDGYPLPEDVSSGKGLLKRFKEELYDPAMED